MNYRHHFHAGNFADVMKHALLVQLITALQKKEKGYLYLDTHAGRGGYDLEVAATGDSLARKPEWPEGIGRLLNSECDPPPVLTDYLDLVRDFDQRGGNLQPGLRFYPGSPWIAHRLARFQDRLVLCERHPEECGALRMEFNRAPRVSVQETDGYVALRAMLPPPERRALILIDPPYEAQNEFAQIAESLREGLVRFPTGVFAVWYPLTGRARVDEFFASIRSLNPPPTIAVELGIAGEPSAVTLKGCGLVVINPPWKFEEEAASLLAFLAQALAQAPGGGWRIDWIVPET
jgi:23S rRNA (adenine2030-N6)-methyltransferase